MVVVHFLVGVVGTSGLDDFLDLLDLHDVGGGVEDVDIVLADDGEGGQQVFLQTVGRALVQILVDEVGHLLAEVEGGGLQGVTRLVLELLGVLVTNAVVLLHGRLDHGLKALLLDHTGNQTSGLLTTDGVLHADTVLDVLDLDLVAEGGVLVGGVLALTAVLGELNDDLGEDLILHAVGRGGSADVVGVGEEDLTGSQVLDGHLTGLLICIDGVVPFGGLLGHGSQLIRGGGVDRGDIILDQDFILIPRGLFGGCVCCRCGDDGKASKYAAKHQNSQEE